MSAKDSNSGKSAQSGANNFSGSSAPSNSSNPTLPCQKKHWFGVRVVDDKGKPVAGVKLKLKLSDGSTPDVTSDKNGQFKTDKVLPPGTCEVALPETFDLEWKEQ